MATTRTEKLTTRPTRPESPTHLFAIGQAVRMKGVKGRYVISAIPNDAIYHITGTLPPRGDALQYRIRNDDERHERVTTEGSLEPVDPSHSDTAALIERTFGHGQRSETQQPRDQETEAEKSSS